MTPTTHKALRIVLAAALAAFALIVLSACGAADQVDPGSAADAPDYSAAIESAPPKLAALYANGDELIDGGLDAFEAQLAELRGFPVVVNVWGSWCGPCRAEFPHFQEQAAEHAGEVAFLGVDSEDSVDAAETFLRDHPIPYPSILDPDRKVAQSLDVLSLPGTVFYDAEGEIVHVRRGVYADEAELAADIDRYALAG